MSVDIEVLAKYMSKQGGVAQVPALRIEERGGLA
jgi:hypothetical protein